PSPQVVHKQLMRRKESRADCAKMSKQQKGTIDAENDQTAGGANMIEVVVRIVRGGVTVPARLRRQLGLEEGTLVGLEVHDGSVIIRRARIVPESGSLHGT